jgi:hypothetical protein
MGLTSALEITPGAPMLSAVRSGSHRATNQSNKGTGSEPTRRFRSSLNLSCGSCRRFSTDSSRKTVRARERTCADVAIASPDDFRRTNKSDLLTSCNRAIWAAPAVLTPARRNSIPGNWATIARMVLQLRDGAQRAMRDPDALHVDAGKSCQSIRPKYCRLLKGQHSQSAVT